MLLTKIEQEKFMSKYSISSENFAKSHLSWANLDDIANDHLQHQANYESNLKDFAEKFQASNCGHSISYRIKDAEHLIEKIIRKNSSLIAKGDSITIDNYKDKITDLMGIRILILFKQDWINVHKFIESSYENSFMEIPVVYLLNGDDLNLYKNENVKIIEREQYRSTHYSLKTKCGTCMEIQVRTLFEEAWGEINHRIRYPYNMTNEMINGYIILLSKLAGIGDEMGEFIRQYIANFEEAKANGYANDEDVYNYILSELEDCSDIEVKNSIVEKINKAIQYKKTEKITTLFNKIIHEL